MPLAGVVGSGYGSLGNKNVGGGIGRPVGGGGHVSGSIGGIGSTFGNIYGASSGAPNANISRPKVELPGRGDYGTPVMPTGVKDPTRGSYGTPDASGIAETAAAGREARAGFNDPTSTAAFQNLMGLAQEQTGVQQSERRRHAADVGQRRGYSGGFEDEAREAESDRMSALASAGFAAGDRIRQQEGEQYGRAIGAFAELQTSYNEAKAAGDIAYAQDLTAAHIASAQNALQAAGLNMQQQVAFGSALNEAKMLQAKLDQDYNNSLIDNNRYIQAQQQIAAQLMAQQMAIREKQREFDVESRFRDRSFAEGQRQFNADDAFRNKALGEKSREFDTSILADPGTAPRALGEASRPAWSARSQRPRQGSMFTGLS